MSAKEEANKRCYQGTLYSQMLSERQQKTEGKHLSVNIRHLDKSQGLDQQESVQVSDTNVGLNSLPSNPPRML